MKPIPQITMEAETREQFMARWGMIEHKSPIIERLDRLEKAVIQLQEHLIRYNMMKLEDGKL